MASPNMLTTFFKAGEREKCDFTCFEVLLAGGSAVLPGLAEDIQVKLLFVIKAVHHYYYFVSYIIQNLSNVYI